MKLELKRSLNIQRYRVIAEIEQAQKRPEIYAVLLMAREKSGVSAQEVAKHLLDKPETVGRRLLQICSEYKLLESSRNGYILTDAGNEALDKEKVFVPEKGTWEVWVTDDPLWPTGLVKIETYREPDANKEKYDKERPAHMKPLPGWIQKNLTEQKFVTPLLAGQAEYRFADLKGQAERVENIEPHMTLTLTIPEQGKPSLVFNDGKKDYRHDAPEIAFADAWRQFLELYEMLEDWNDERQVLKVAFNDMDAANLKAFLVDQKFQQPELTNLDGEDLGEFDDTIVENIPIAPATQADADAWASWLLEWEINRYAVQGEFAVMQDKVRPKFPDFSVNLPEQALLAQALRSTNRQAFWHLQAPLDWAI